MYYYLEKNETFIGPINLEFYMVLFVNLDLRKKMKPNDDKMY